jgi:APA family basic amino acid/polyamine antiporter
MTEQVPSTPTGVPHAAPAARRDEFTFARKASGLTRGLSAFDAYGVALMTIQPIQGIWFMFLYGAGLFPDGNLAIALLISAVTICIASPLVWGMLGGSMPRSGGEYIFNSRIINPVIGFGASFAALAGIIYWQAFTPTWIAVPSLTMMSEFLGWEGMTTFLNSDAGKISCGFACLIAAFLTVTFGMKVFSRIQKPLVVIAIAGPVLLAIALTAMSKADFVAYWNQTAAQYGSLDYNAFIAAVSETRGEALPTTFTAVGTIGALTGVIYVFLWTYTTAYIGGEVKRPGKNMANLACVWTGVGLGLWTVLALYKTVGMTFLGAAAYNDLFGWVEGYSLPYSSSYMTLGWMASRGNSFVAVMASLSFLVTVYMVTAVCLLILSRSTLAWALDRMGPKFFGDISARYASPVKSYAFWTVVQMVGVSIYVLWLGQHLAGLTASGMQYVSLFGVTALSAALFAYRKRVVNIWRSSPYYTWRVFGIPVMTIAGIVYLAFLSVILYFAFLNSRTRDVTWKNLLVFAAVWTAGICWYYYWRAQNKKKSDFDVSIAYRELPPE